LLRLKRSLSNHGDCGRRGVRLRPMLDEDDGVVAGVRLPAQAAARTARSRLGLSRTDDPLGDPRRLWHVADDNCAVRAGHLGRPADAETIRVLLFQRLDGVADLVAAPSGGAAMGVAIAG